MKTTQRAGIIALLIIIAVGFGLSFGLILAGSSHSTARYNTPDTSAIAKEVQKTHAANARNKDANQPLLDGIYTPSISITNDDGTFNYEKWGEHLDHLADAGINGVLLFGSIGEFYTFSTQQKIDALHFAINRVGDRMDVLFGIGSTDMNESKELMLAAKEAGATAVVSIVPYYFGPSDTTCVSYYQELSQTADIPIILYNFPARTNVDLTPELVAEIVRAAPTVKGIKDTVDTASHTRLMVEKVHEVDPTFSVLSGYDEYYLTNRISGGNGVLSGLTNVEPETFVEMNHAYNTGDMDTAVSCAKRIAHLMDLYNVGDLFISAIKGGVKAKGLDISTNIQEPAQQLSAQEYAKIEEIIQ